MATKGTKKDQQKASKDKATLNTASNIKLDTSLSALGTAGVRINNTLASIQEELISKHSELQAVDNAIDLRKKEMEELHGKDKILLSMDELDAAHQADIARMDTEREDLKRSYEDLNVQLETARRREEQEFQYNLAQKRKKDEDTWQEQIVARTKLAAEQKERLEKSWTEREMTLQTRESEYKTALDKAATFDVEVARVADREKHAALGSQKKDNDHEKALTAIQHKAEVERLSAEVTRDKTIISNQEAVINSLQTQLQKANDAQVALASKVAEAGNNKAAQAEALSTVLAAQGGGNGARPRS